MLVRGNAEVEDFYHQAMQDAWQARNQLLDMGVPPSLAAYVLPNATAVRLVETGSLLHLLHKWTMRTCFNAQEEIYAGSMEELEQVREVHPPPGPVSRAPVPSSPRHRLSGLHRRKPLLRRPGVGHVPQRGAKAVGFRKKMMGNIPSVPGCPKTHT